MEPKIEIELLKQLSGFVGKKLKSAKLKETKVNNKNVLLLALIFSNKGKDEALVLSLDKGVILGGYKIVGGKL